MSGSAATAEHQALGARPRAHGTAASLPRRPQPDDDVSHLLSGATDLDTWLQQFAWENQRANNAVTHVIADGDRVAGYAGGDARRTRRRCRPVAGR
jgi:hypothetical protein